jgi:hypothetical protein
MRDSGESVVGPNFFNNIIGPSRRRWDRSGIRVYNQAFLQSLFVISISWHVSGVTIYSSLKCRVEEPDYE